MSIPLPPLPIHPEPMSMQWSALELTAIRARDQEIVRAVLDAAAKLCADSTSLHCASAGYFANAIRALEFKHE